MAIDPSLLVDKDKFKSSCSDLVRIIKASRSSDGQPVRLPGERTQASFNTARERGTVDIDEAVLKELGYI